MKFVMLHCSDGNVISTRMNGTNEEISSYYVVDAFINTGTVCDRFTQIVKVDIEDMDAVSVSLHGFECPRCRNEEITLGQSYCQICGRELDQSDH